MTRKKQRGQISLEESLKNKARTLRKLMASFEFKVILGLFALAILSTSAVLYLQGYRISVEPASNSILPIKISITWDYTQLKDFKARNEHCTTLGQEMQQHFEDSTLNCNCYYEANKTENPTLNVATKPMCTCNCTNDTTTTIISIRS